MELVIIMPQTPRKYPSHISFFVVLADWIRESHLLPVKAFASKPVFTFV